jgi:PIN domain nuclease of toxin-antitoxin system
MRLLLDTHALLWWWNDDHQLSLTARQAMADEDNEVLVSAASAWEIATKQRIGKLPPFPADAGSFHRLLQADGFRLLPVAASHAWHAGALAALHRDPFDRMLAAQSELEQLTLVTCDTAFHAFRVQTLW